LKICLFLPLNDNFFKHCLPELKLSFACPSLFYSKKNVKIDAGNKKGLAKHPFFA